MDDFTIIAWAMFSGAVAAYMFYVFRISHSGTSSEHSSGDKWLNNLLLGFIAACLIVGFIMPCLNMSPSACKIPVEQASVTRYDTLGIILFGIGLLFLATLKVYSSHVTNMGCVNEDAFGDKLELIDKNSNQSREERQQEKGRLLAAKEDMKEFIKGNANFHIHYYIGQGLVFATLCIANLILVAKNT
jgi:hypothetical protein